MFFFFKLYVVERPGDIFKFSVKKAVRTKHL